VIVRRQVGVVEAKYRVNWKKVEFADDIDSIVHPIVREALRFLEIDFPVEINTLADIPSQTGLGSSSSFAVGLLHALYALKGKQVKKSTLAANAATIEIDILGRSIGKQDHYAAAYGGLNKIYFGSDGSVDVVPIFYDQRSMVEVCKNMGLFYTSKTRDASEILVEQSKKAAQNFELLREMRGQVDELASVITSSAQLDSFGRILNRAWELKKKLSQRVSDREIDEYHARAMEVGAYGGKLLGAGGGGFLLLVCPPNRRSEIQSAMGGIPVIDFRIDVSGSRITYYDGS
jgi:D-glycero-alpha-D-manno-heptose-7-phosphate kinase